MKLIALKKFEDGLEETDSLEEGYYGLAKRLKMVLKKIELGIEKKVWDGFQEADSFEEV